MIGLNVCPFSNEKSVLALIQNGYKNLGISQNNHLSMISLMKIDYTPEIEKYLYHMMKFIIFFMKHFSFCSKKEIPYFIFVSFQISFL